MNTLDVLEHEMALEGRDDDALVHLVRVARAAQKIDLREDDLPHAYFDPATGESRTGTTRARIQELHLALSPLLEELPE